MDFSFKNGLDLIEEKIRLNLCNFLCVMKSSFRIRKKYITSLECTLKYISLERILKSKYMYKFFLMLEFESGK